ncbi:NHL repeat-containing protein [Flavobacterium laiguense]|uniref:SMP-30/Gluconolactonase/LRE-like region domain-containing protein n=1 Tax=Flavobacterium laiguense TaxID=2169409 RepID=A0A2U1K0H3_9FLAO|nr:hypothetical protein [Flavobacterium laiguense]PWA10986.1 hypothetical protein DB891_03905 [Flavobacterium laiguense]
MKKILLSLLLFVAIATQGQTHTIASQLKLGTVNQGTSNDSVLVRGVDKLVKFIPRSQFVSPAAPIPTLQQVLLQGGYTIENIFMNGGHIVSYQVEDGINYSSQLGNKGFTLQNDFNNGYTSYSREFIKAGTTSPEIYNKLLLSNRVASGEALYSFDPNKIAGNYTIVTKDEIPNLIPSVDYLTPTGNASGLTNFPILNQNTTGVASNITGNILQSQVTNLVSDLSAKQSTLISGANIKTLNGTSILGSGNLVVSPGTSISGGTSNRVPKFNATGDNIVNSSITDTGALVTIANPTEINSGVSGTSGLKFTNLTSIPSPATSNYGLTGTYPHRMVVTNDGTLYVADRADGTISKITPAGVSTVFATPGGVYLSGLLFDSLGNLFVTNRSLNVIHKILPDGTVTTFATLPAGSLLTTIKDSSDNLYVARVVGSNSSYIDKITPAGVLTLYSTVGTGSTTFGGLVDMALNPTTGDIFTVHIGSGSIYKISTAGVSTYFASTNSQECYVIKFDNNTNNLYSYGLATSTSLLKTNMSGITSLLSTVGGGFDLNLDSLGNIYTIGNSATNITKTTPAGVSTIIGTTGANPRCIAVDINRTVYSANRTPRNITKITQPTNRDVLALDNLGNVTVNSNIVTDAGGLAYAPNANNTLIGAEISGKSLITKEYLGAKIGTTAPASATDTGTTGDIRVVPGYVYWCIATNTWVRTAGTTF